MKKNIDMSQFVSDEPIITRHRKKKRVFVILFILFFIAFIIVSVLRFGRSLFG